MVKPERKIVMKKKKRPSRPSRFSNSTDRSRPAANFEKLRDDLFLEAAKLVTENPSHRIAIIIAPRASEPNGAMQSFGHPSAESVVRKFLKDSAPPEKVVDDEEEEEEEDEDWSKYYWWEDEKLVNSKDPVEIMAAMEEMKKLQKQLEVFKSSYFGGSGRGEGSGTKDDESKP
ncbi:unnamed protein product [Eruca vesicaria subsp. sativa]|uniref:Uncharacterized protein n=1 Tax=Eruca vesicaria subsp. sativa TaxID=29727 RepID=A0ABC8KUA5_ERUVS|nr:unnamed protein product [Eruca vesicaria subsp. sativa]